MQEFAGYRAKIEVSVSVKQIEQPEAILIGIVEHGVRNIRNVRFKTSKLREHRSIARAAARWSPLRRLSPGRDLSVGCGGRQLRDLVELNPAL